MAAPPRVFHSDFSLVFREYLWIRFADLSILSQYVCSLRKFIYILYIVMNHLQFLHRILLDQPSTGYKRHFVAPSFYVSEAIENSNWDRDSVLKDNLIYYFAHLCLIFTKITNLC